MHLSFILSRLLLALLLLAAPFARADQRPEQLHQPWDALIKSHVQPDGSVNYQGFADDEARLLQYLQTLRRTTPSTTWSRADQAAFWINTYNAYTVYLAVQYYPVQRLSDIKIKTVGGNRSAWEALEVNVGGKLYSLDQIERNILPAVLPGDPRRYLALHCAAASSPSLLPEAYDGARLNTQLAQQTQRFVNDPVRNHISPASAQLSSLFEWHAGDFGDKAQLVTFLNQYLDTPLAADAVVSYVPYDWSLNDSHGTAVMAQRRR